MNDEFDLIIIGQGLAGTALAWECYFRGWKFVIVDRQDKITASRIAAGLITPITGQKLAPSWRFRELWPVAENFYQQIGSQLGQDLLQKKLMVRFLADSAQRRTFRNRQAAGEYSDLISDHTPTLDPIDFVLPEQAFEMVRGGRLCVNDYLDQSRKFFKSQSAYIETDVDITADIVPQRDQVAIPSLSLTSRRLVFCEGIAGKGNRWFPDVKFKLAKGEILTLRIPDWHEQRIIHNGIWLVNVESDIYQAGATYEWKQLDNNPTEVGLEWIENALSRTITRRYEIVNHQAAIRPIHWNQYPVIGSHHSYPSLWFFNGLGSKGGLQAPYFAKHLIDVAVGRCAIDQEVDMDRKVSDTLSAKEVTTSKWLSLTDYAHTLIRNTIKPGEFAIDATAGNGRDTRFLLQQVGPVGHVLGIDLQIVALENTRQRLSDLNPENYTLLQEDHRNLIDLIPKEYHGKVAAIMFNLGYLPGGDRTVTTNIPSTLSAMRQAASVLRPGGILTVIAYTGHPGGHEEAAAVQDCMDGFSDQEFLLQMKEGLSGRGNSPKLFALTKRERD